VADDHPVVRDGLVAILGTQPDFAVVGEAASGQDAVRLVETLRPDVLLLDLEMPGLDGVQVLERLREARASVRAIVFTAFDTDERILGAVRAGAQGYLLKGVPREDIFRAVRVVYAGGSLLEPLVASKLLRQVGQAGQVAQVGHTSGAAGQPGSVQPALTPREREVLQEMARGLQNKEIALRLHMSERTVKFHAGAIFRKLGAGNRTEAVTLAMQRRLIDPPH
jgi:DNA-binding NarL/FixJ family response regulator